jgi:hypothetical protein
MQQFYNEVLFMKVVDFFTTKGTVIYYNIWLGTHNPNRYQYPIYHTFHDEYMFNIDKIKLK